ncbi:hypothetical protein H0H92_002572 [Tricholoma furcatifolium]|nr:hypothetical protein H0H92_002572 [Tricholoma furcatifolium]
MSFPQPGTFYRIRSADFDTCLEVWDTDEELAVLRPLKETELQQWLFIKESGPGDRYKIMAAATQSLRYPNYLTIATPGDASQPRPPAPPTLVDDKASIWQITKDKDDAYVLTTNGKAPRHEAFLRVSEAGMLDSIEKRASNRQVTNRSERWQITEYWPSIPQDTYRIRTLNGGALEINPNLNGLAVGAVRADYRQQWLVEPKGNGNCVLSLNANDKEKVFLGWERGKDGFARIAATKTPFEWFIRSLGEYTYS